MAGLGFASICLAVYAKGLPELDDSEVLVQARFGGISTGELAGTDFRVTEAKDAISTFTSEGTGLDYLFGFGNGATYSPQASIAPDTNLLESGRVHHVHFTFAMVLLRYGFLGLGAYLILLISVTFRSIKALRTRRTFCSIFAFSSWAFYCFDLVVRDSFVDPGFSLTIAAVVVAASQARDEP